MKRKLIATLLVLLLVGCMAGALVGCTPTDNSVLSADGNWRYTVEDVYYVEADAEGNLVNDTVQKHVKVTLLHYKGNAANVTVPATVDGHTVTDIADSLFMLTANEKDGWKMSDTYAINPTLKSVTFEFAAKRISNLCFYQCAELTSVTFPASLAQVGDFAFFGCKKLTGVTLTLSEQTEMIYTAATKAQQKDLSSAIDAAKATFGADKIDLFIRTPQTLKPGIGGYAFRECAALGDMNLVSSILPTLGDKAFYVVDENADDDNQYVIIPGLTIHVATALPLYDAEDIEQHRIKTKINDYRYWIEYINAEIIVA